MSRRWNGSGRARAAAAVAAIVMALLLAACSAPQSENTGQGGTAVAPGAPTVSGGSKSGSTDFGALDGQAAPDAPTASPSAPSAVSPEKLVVINKTMRIETPKVDEAIAAIRTLVARDNAEIQSMQVATAVDEPIYREPQPLADGSVTQSSSGPLRAYVTVRVPADRYRAFVADAAKLGTVLTESETSDDVTQQHVDMKARLDNLTAEQTRLRQLFARATSVKDMLAIEQELTRVQGDIESMKAQIAYLERQAAMATVTLELTEPPAIVRPTGTDWGVGTALTGSIRAFVATMNGLIVILGPVLALLVFVGLPVALVAWLVSRAARRHRARFAAAAIAAPDTAEPLEAIDPESDEIGLP